MTLRAVVASGAREAAALASGAHEAAALALLALCVLGDVLPSQVGSLRTSMSPRPSLSSATVVSKVTARSGAAYFFGVGGRMFFGAGGAVSIVTPAPLYPILPDFDSVSGAAPEIQTPRLLASATLWRSTVTCTPGFVAAEPVAPEPVAPEPVAPEPVAPEPRAELDHVDLSGKGSPGPGTTGTLISLRAVISACECTLTYGTSGASD